MEPFITDREASMQAVKERERSVTPLTDAVAQFRREGYWIGRGLIPADVVLRVRAQMHEVFVRQLRHLGIAPSRLTGENAMHEDMATLLKADTARYLAALRLCPKLMGIWQLFMHERVHAFATAVGIAEAAFQTAPVLHVMSADLRVPGGYYGYPVHQDWPALQSSLDTITVWIPFVAVDECNYTMDIIPGSHKGGLYPGAMTPNAYEIDAGHWREDDFIPVRAEPGDVFFMSCFMVHRSSVKGGDRVRIASSMRYENAAEDAFVAHAYPFVHKRVVERGFLVADYPTAAQVRAVFE
jgi:hypothetical protein